MSSGVGAARNLTLYADFASLANGDTLTIGLGTGHVTLAAGSDRRIVGVLATLQAALPLAAYGLAFLIPALVHRNRRGGSADRAPAAGSAGICCREDRRVRRNR